MAGKNFISLKDFAVRVFIGTYPAPESDDQPTLPEGIWRADFDLESASLRDLTQVTEVTAPSFLAVSPDHGALYAVSEASAGELHRYGITGDGLEHLATVASLGESPCHVTLASSQVVVANYGSGSVASYPHQEFDSGIGEGKLFQQSGEGPVTDRQGGPHAHFAGKVPGTQYVWVTDLGADRIFGYQITANGSGVRQLVALGTAVEFPAGSGPRHIAFDGDGYGFVVGELDNNLYTVAVDPATGQGEVVNTFSLDIPGEEAQWPSHIEFSPDGELLVVAVRGSNTLHMFTIARTEGQITELVAAGTVPTGGQWPRHFKLFGKRSDGLQIIAVANQFSQTIDILGLNAADGTGKALSSTPLMAPACIVGLD